MTREQANRMLEQCRDRIDDADRRLVDLLNERARVVEELGELKEQLGLGIYEPKREEEVFANILDANMGPLPPDALRRLFERIVDEMRTLQRINREARKARQ